jgi:serine protease Do
MKRLAASIACVTFLILSMVFLNWQKAPPQLDAQESPRDTAEENFSKPSAEGAEQNIQPADASSPEYFVEDVIKILTAAAEEMIEKKISRTAVELHQELDRSLFKLELPKPSLTPLRSQELYRRTIESVFLVAGLTKPSGDETAWQTSFSTAFVVHEDGILSTSAHVFDHDDHDDAVVVMDVRGQVYPVLEILAANRTGDTCLFRISKKGLKPLALGPAVHPGSQINVIGHPGDSFFYFSAGHVANYERDEEGLLWLNITADFGQGSSGGPVMDEAGNVVGQVSRTYTLYAGGDASNRRRRQRTKQSADHQPDEGPAESDENAAVKKRADPQMVFKACTPVSSIRALTK